MDDGERSPRCPAQVFKASSRWAAWPRAGCETTVPRRHRDVIDQTRCATAVDGRRAKIGFAARLTTLWSRSSTARSGKVKKAFDDAKILEKWRETAWAKRPEQRRKRASLNDFDRFKASAGSLPAPARGAALTRALTRLQVMVLRKKRARLLSKALAA